jgi:hypothetical protein
VPRSVQAMMLSYDYSIPHYEVARPFRCRKLAGPNLSLNPDISPAALRAVRSATVTLVR